MEISHVNEPRRTSATHVIFKLQSSQEFLTMKNNFVQIGRPNEGRRKKITTTQPKSIQHVSIRFTCTANLN